MTTKHGPDLYRTLEVEDKDGHQIITFNDHMKETVIRYPDGREETSYSIMNVHQLDHLTALYEAAQETKEPEFLETVIDNTDDVMLSEMGEEFSTGQQEELDSIKTIREQSRDDEMELER
jgi:hypothetical protein